MAEQGNDVGVGAVRSADAVDRDACMGSGNCAFWAPGVFDLDDDGIAVVVGDPSGRREDVRKAAANCPTSAIRLDRLFPS
jgi:ferredoxin